MTTQTNIQDSAELKKLTANSLLPTNDVIFHCLFGTVGNEKITKDFIEKIVKKNVEEYYK